MVVLDFWCGPRLRERDGRSLDMGEELGGLIEGEWFDWCFGVGIESLRKDGLGIEVRVSYISFTRSDKEGRRLLWEGCD